MKLFVYPLLMSLRAGGWNLQCHFQWYILFARYPKVCTYFSLRYLSLEFVLMRVNLPIIFLHCWQGPSSRHQLGTSTAWMNQWIVGTFVSLIITRHPNLQSLMACHRLQPSQNRRTTKHLKVRKWVAFSEKKDLKMCGSIHMPHCAHDRH